jgi:hypothetical protein
LQYTHKIFARRARQNKGKTARRVQKTKKEDNLPVARNYLQVSGGDRKRGDDRKGVEANDDEWGARVGERK